MKKVFTHCFSAIIFAASLISIASSQDVRDLTAAGGTAYFNPNPSSVNPKSTAGTASLKVYDVSTRAVRDFFKYYKGAQYVKWYRVMNGTDGFLADFNDGDVTTRVYYDKRGNWEGTIRGYHEDNLPGDIRHRIKSIYYDFNIPFIAEVSHEKRTVYIVSLEGKTSWKKIMVAEGEEMVELEGFSKN